MEEVRHCEVGRVALREVGRVALREVGRVAPRPPSRTLLENIAGDSLVVRFSCYQGIGTPLVSPVAERPRAACTEEGWGANIKNWISFPQKISLSLKKWHYISLG